MTDWNKILSKQSNPPKAAIPNPEARISWETLLQPYYLNASGKWSKIEFSQIHKIKVGALFNGPYLFKGIKYYCGNDQVWIRLQDKENREWLHVFLKELYAPAINDGLTWDHLTHISLKHAIVIWMAHRVLGGNFLCKKIKALH